MTRTCARAGPVEAERLNRDQIHSEQNKQEWLLKLVVTAPGVLPARSATFQLRPIIGRIEHWLHIATFIPLDLAQRVSVDTACVAAHLGRRP